MRADSLRFGAEEAITGSEAARSLEKLRDLQGTAAIADVSEIANQKSLEWTSLAKLGGGADKKRGAVKRGEFVDWLVKLYESKSPRK